MFYYHGSNVKFDKFSTGRTIHLTPSYEYAENYARNKEPIGDACFVYTVRVKTDDPDIKYNAGMCNMVFATDVNLEIVKVEEIKTKA